MGVIQFDESAIEVAEKRLGEDAVTALQSSGAEAETKRQPEKKKRRRRGETHNFSNLINDDGKFDFAPWRKRAQELHEANPETQEGESLPIPIHPALAYLNGARLLHRGFGRFAGQAQVGKSRAMAFLASDYQTYAPLFAKAVEGLVPEAKVARHVNVVFAYSEISGMQYLSYLPFPPKRVYLIHKLADIVPVLQYAKSCGPTIVIVDSVSDLLPDYIHPSKHDKVQNNCTTKQRQTALVPIMGDDGFRPRKIPIHEIEWATVKKRGGEVSWLKTSPGLAPVALAMSRMGPILSAYAEIPVMATNHFSSQVGFISYLKAKGGNTLKHLVFPDLAFGKIKGQDVARVIKPAKAGVPEERELTYYPRQGGFFWGLLRALGAAQDRYKMKSKAESLGAGWMFKGTDEEQHIRFDDVKVWQEALSPELVMRLTAHVYANCHKSVMPNFQPLEEG